MLIKYSWLAGKTKESVHADVVGLITNTLPDINSCSDSCDKANSEIIANSIPSNWTSYGTVLGMMRSQNVNGTYKYAYLTPGIQTDDGGLNSVYRFLLSASESVDPETNVRSNIAGEYRTGYIVANTSPGSVIPGKTGITASSVSDALTVAGSIYIYATAHNLYIDGAFLGEFASVSEAIGETYPRHVIYNMATTVPLTAPTLYKNSVGISRVKRSNGYGDITGSYNSSVLPVVYCSVVDVSSCCKILRTPDEVSFFQALPLYVRCSPDDDASFLVIGKMYEVVHVPNTITTSLMDEIQINGTTYFKLGSYTAAEAHHVFAPKG